MQKVLYFRLKNLGSFDLSFFVGDVAMRVGLYLFGPLHLALGPKRKRKLFVSFLKGKLAENPHL